MIPVINIMLMPFVSIGENLTFHVFSLRTCFIHTYSFDDCLYSSLSQMTYHRSKDFSSVGKQNFQSAEIADNG